MRLIRFGPKGQERPGLLRENRIVDLWTHFPEMPDIGEAFFRQGWLLRIAGISDPGKPFQTRLGCPLVRPSKIICLGKNYPEHAREGGFTPPPSPLLFAKAPSALNGPEDPIVLPSGSGKVDWEVELALVVGKEGKRIPKGAAMEYVAAVTVMNDVSGREAQFGDGQWFRGKSFDTFAPLGPCLTTLDEIADLSELKLTTRVDGILMQEGFVKEMLFDIPTLLAFISENITLYPGDILSTGTPSGVGIFRDPPMVLRAGNVVECAIDRIGALVNPVISDAVISAGSLPDKTPSEGSSTL